MTTSRISIRNLLLKLKIGRILKFVYLFLVKVLFIGGISFILLFNIIHSSGSAYLKGPWIAWVLFLLIAIPVVYLIIKLIIELSGPGGKFTRILEKENPQFGTRITGSVDLLENGIHGASSVLADAYIGQAEESLKGVAVLSAPVIFRLVKLSVFFIPLILFIVVLSELYPISFHETMNLFHFQDRIEAVVLKPPVIELKKVIIGDISVKYVFPSYTGIPAKIENNCTGRIKCLKGTSVFLSGKCDKPLKGARLETASGVKIPVKLENKTLGFTINVLQSDSYRLICEDSSGKESSLLSDSILCENDEYPIAELNAPMSNLTVRKREVIPLGYRATDDFGIKKIRMLVIRKGQEEATVVKDGVNMKEAADQYSLDLSPYMLKDGDEGYIVLEASDNDAVSGSKKSHSSPVAFTVLDESRAHVELEKKLRALVEKMLNLLADHLEEGFKPSDGQDQLYMKSAAYDSKAFDVLQAGNEVLLAMENDPKTSDEIYNALKGFVSGFGEAVEMRKGMVSRIISKINNENFPALYSAENEEIKGLEDFIYFMEEAREREKVMNALSMADDIVKQQKELEDRMKDAKMDEKIKALFDEFNSLKQELSKLFDQIMKDRKESTLPQEFLNADAMKNLPADDISDAMKKIEDALKKGDADKAFAEMMKLRDLMDQMSQSLNSAANEFNTESNSKQMAMMQKSMKELQDLIERQTRLNSEGDKMMDASGEEMRKMMEDILRKKREEISRMFDRLLSMIDTMGLAGNSEKGRAFQNQARDLKRKTVDAKNIFLSGNEERSASVLSENRHGFENAAELSLTLADSGKASLETEKARKLNEDIIFALSHKYPGMDKMMSKEASGNMGKMANDEGSIMQKLKAMAEGMKGALEGMGESGKGMSENMDGALSGLGSSYNNLSEYNLPSAMPSAKSGLYHLMRMQEGMKQCMSQMKQGNGMIPMPYGTSFGTGRNGNGRAGTALGSVEIGKETGKDNKLKEMIKDAIKEKGPENYDQDNKKYYEKLGN